MSGHSKWHSIKHKKGAIDAQRGKLFTRHANLITIAARQGGGDPLMNPSLRLAIDNAKKDNVPNANIERAVKRGTGELKDGAVFEQITYEAFGPCGVAILVDCFTDNKNRTVTNLRTALNKGGGNLGNSGSVSWMFDRKGLIVIDAEGRNAEELELLCIDAGAEDIRHEDNLLEVITAPADLNRVAEALKKAGLELEKAELAPLPNQTVEIDDEAMKEKLGALLEALDEDNDVNAVFSNWA